MRKQKRCINALVGNEKVLRVEPPSTLKMASLALTLWDQGRWNEAEELETLAMEPRERVLRPVHCGGPSKVA
jgi:hypothetical protein